MAEEENKEVSRGQLGGQGTLWWKLDVLVWGTLFTQGGSAAAVLRRSCAPAAPRPCGWLWRTVDGAAKNWNQGGILL